MYFSGNVERYTIVTFKYNLCLWVPLALIIGLMSIVLHFQSRIMNQ